MKRRIECWIAEQILLVAEDDDADPDVRAWLRGHRAKCTRHAAAARRPAEPSCDEDSRRLALERIGRSFADAPAPGPTLPGWLSDLLFDFHAAPLAMSALSALALLIVLGGARFRP